MSENNKSISNTELFGKSDVELWIEKKKEVYDIKKEINNFGITDKQRYFLLYVLAQEIENVENSREISSLILKCRPDIKILSDV